MVHALLPCTIRRCISHPPGAVFKLDCSKAKRVPIIVPIVPIVPIIMAIVPIIVPIVPIVPIIMAIVPIIVQTSDNVTVNVLCKC